MILGVGTDIVENSRFTSWLNDSKKMERFFHKKELEKEITCGHLASRFAAKEALVKAFGTGFRGITLKNICLCNDENGKPFFQLFGDALICYEKIGSPRIYVSISHEKTNSLAFVILEN